MKHQLSVEVDDALKAKIDALVKQHGVSIALVCRVALTNGLPAAENALKLLAPAGSPSRKLAKV